MKKKLQLSSETVANVVNHLHKGRKRAITHKELMKVTGLGDRTLRRALEIARLEYCIINNQDGRGYYLASTKAEAERYDRQELARARAIHRRRRGTRLFLQKIEGQQELNV